MEPTLKLSPQGATGNPTKNSLNSRVNAFKRAIFVETLQKTGGNVPEAARMLDISHSYLSRSIRSFKIQLP
jgi:DNA-binding NtrC family response regulator